MLQEKRMTVSRAARRAGLTPKAVRLYESKGLLHPAPRTEAGYRLYRDDDVQVLRFVRQARALGLNLADIREIIDLQRDGAQPCGRVLGLVDARLNEVDRALRDLRALRRTLQRARAAAGASQARGDDAVVCRIIESADGGPTEKS
jgi:MerR family transcriptional regulator, copper efflux regulator